MSEPLQSGQHPDADQLSAFIEHVLPAHEQEETLAHLAVCPDCRRVVTLSLPAVEELPKPARRPWLSGWNLVWPATAALAALVLVGVLLRNGSSVPSHVPPSQTALSYPPEAPVTLHQLLPRSAAQPARSVTQQTPPPSAAAPIAKQHDTLAGRNAGQIVTAAPAVSGVLGGISRSTASAAGAAQSSTVSVTAANDAVQLENVVVRSTVGLDQAQVILSHHPLPSGLRALSAVANARQAVAIDANNTLFLSDDGGEHWNVISPPWPTHAVKVELVSSTFEAATGIDGGNVFTASPAAVPSDTAAPAKSSLRGEVTDPSGASIPSASVVVTNSLTQAARTTKTDSSGHYAVDNLDSGTYTLEAEAAGFNPKQISGVALNPAQQSQMNLKLAVGSSSQTVEIHGQSQLAPFAPLVAARRALLPRFEITTDTGERWTSIDGRSWKRK